jgi:hypothetical protein
MSLTRADQIDSFRRPLNGVARIRATVLREADERTYADFTPIQRHNSCGDSGRDKAFMFRNSCAKVQKVDSFGTCIREFWK